MPTIYVETISVNISKVGFKHFGEEYLYYAKQTKMPRGRFSPVPYFLSCQALELLFKAWLSSNGVATAELKNPKKFGHDLAKLFTHSVNLGLGKEVRITKQRTDNVRRAHAFYAGDKKFNYWNPRLAFTPTRLPKLPDRQILHRLGDAIVGVAR